MMEDNRRLQDLVSVGKAILKDFELLEVKAQLEEAVKELEQSLFEVKKAKLLRTLESMTGVCATGVTVTAQPALTSEPAAAATFSSRVPPGAACR